MDGSIEPVPTLRPDGSAEALTGMCVCVLRARMSMRLIVFKHVLCVIPCLALKSKRVCVVGACLPAPAVRQLHQLFSRGAAG